MLLWNILSLCDKIIADIQEEDYENTSLIYRDSLL